MKQPLVLFEPSTEELIIIINNLSVALEFAFNEALNNSNSLFEFRDFVEQEIYSNYDNIIYCQNYIKNN